jgi:tetratricopeptide (TPR) repeat protein
MHSKAFLIRFSFLLAVVLGITANMPGGEDIFLPKPDMEEARKLATESGKKLLVVITTDSCGACKHVKNETLANPAMAELMKAFFVSININKSTPEGKEAWAKFSPHEQEGVPHLYVYDGNEQKVHLYGTPATSGGLACRLLEPFVDWKHDPEKMKSLLDRMEKAMPGYTDDPNCITLKAIVMHYAGMEEELESFYGLSYNKYTKHLENYCFHADFMACWRKKHFPEAIAIINAALKIRPTSNTYATLVRIYQEMENYDLALEACEKWAKVAHKTQQWEPEAVKPILLAERDRKKALEEPAPFMADFTAKHFGTEVTELRAGKPIRAKLAKLEKGIAEEGEKGEEAKVILAAVQEWVEKESDRLARFAEKSPGKALYQAETFLKQTKGLEGIATAETLVDNLGKKSVTKKLSMLYEDIAEIEERQAKGKKFDKQLKSLKTKLEKLGKDKTIDPLEQQELDKLGKIASSVG